MNRMNIQPAAVNPAVARTPRRGVSLIEALVAMAVMAFGMLGVVGLQATLRANADLSKQRSEATRLAQEKIEAWRSFSVIPTTAGAKAYAGIVDEAAETLVFDSNTTFTRTVDITDSTPAGHKTMVVDVSWVDRAGTTQNVRLFSMASNVPPGLAATLVAPPQGSGGMREPGGRTRGIPPQAKNFGDGTSGFRPPQGPTGTVAWLFNNTTGVIQSICTTTVLDNSLLTRTDLTGCSSTVPAQLLSGYIRFATTGTPTAAGMVDPTDVVAPTTIEAEVEQTGPAALVGTVACFHQVASVYVQYFCAVPVEAPTPTVPNLQWSGNLRIKASTLPALSTSSADVAAANRKVCRYRALTDPVPAPIYQNIRGPLANENLAIIAAGSGTAAFTCPNPPTRLHQPAT